MSGILKFGATDGLNALLKRNEQWAARLAQEHPGLFKLNAKGQAPQILWIGCADSRAGEACVDLLPGEVFVHRNVANIVPYTDMSSMSVLQLAVDIIKVKHIIVCGHYDCAGVWASLYNKKLGGELDCWLRHLQQVKADHKHELDKIEDTNDKAKRLVELNVISQVYNVQRNDRVARAVAQRGLQVHGVVYSVDDGRLRTVDVPKDENQDLFAIGEDAPDAH